LDFLSKDRIALDTTILTTPINSQQVTDWLDWYIHIAVGKAHGHNGVFVKLNFFLLYWHKSF
jgi:hypothetical protein